MIFGAHTSIAGGIENAPLRAKELGCEVFQMFTRSPQGGKPTFNENSIANFRANLKKSKIAEFYIHAPYYINLASADNRIKYGSISAIREELETGTKLGAKYVMAHLGSAKDYSEKKALQITAESLNKVLENYTGTTEFLIELSAGSGKIMGDTFDDIAYIFKRLKNKKVGVCLDTCHAFASGYDLRTKTAIDKTLREFNKIIGLEKLKLLHLNDSLVELGSRKDRHADIGEGLIGMKTFEIIVNHPKLKKINGIIETPRLKLSDAKSLKILKKLRK
ncbi:deoxyribonuclease IV [Patescibacteria group bacterium]|nr:deoxyribonuclease IV [Patescibacteria group bacterium]